MEQPVKFSPSVMYKFKEYYETFRCEKISIICLMNKGDILYGDEIRLFTEQEHKTQTIDSSSLYPQILLSALNYAVSNNYDYILIIHDHPSNSPYPSTDDIAGFDKLELFLSAHKYPLKQIIGIYSNRQIIFVSDDKIQTRRELSECAEENDYGSE